MNAQQRKKIAEIQTSLANRAEATAYHEMEQARQVYITARANYASWLEELNQGIGTVLDEERDKFDNLPEGLQQAENGQNIEAAIQSLDSAFDSLDDVIGIYNNEFWDTQGSEDPDDNIQPVIDSLGEVL